MIMGMIALPYTGVKGVAEGIAFGCCPLVWLAYNQVVMDSFSKKRPFSVTLALWGVFLLGVWHVGRVITLLNQHALLVSLDIQPNPTVRIILALVWVGLFWGLLIALWQKRPLTRFAIPTTILIYTAYQLIFLLRFTQTTTIQQNLLLHNLFYISLIAFFFWALNRPVAQTYFKKGD